MPARPKLDFIPNPANAVQFRIVINPLHVRIDLMQTVAPLSPMRGRVNAHFLPELVAALQNAVTGRQMGRRLFTQRGPSFMRRAKGDAPSSCIGVNMMGAGGGGEAL